MRLFPIFAILMLFASRLAAQKDQFNPEKKYHADSLKRWTHSVFTGVSEKHPGFYRYTSKEKFDTLIDSTTQTIKDSLTVLDYYRRMKPLVSKIGCLHTSITLSDEYESYLDETSTLIPIEIFVDSEGRALITKSYDMSQNIPAGSELISINGRSMSEILLTLLKAIPSDGFNQTEKILVLNHKFSSWYQTVVDASESFKIEVRNNGVDKAYQLKGVSKKAFPHIDSKGPTYERALDFEVAGNIGFLKIHSFAGSDIKEKGQNFKKFMKSTFRTLKKDSIENLILDLRYNTGGTDGNAVLLATYFFDKPFRYWDKIEVTESVANEIKGTKRIFYKQPVRRDTAYHWRKTWVTSEFDYYETQKPARNNFKGKTFIITNGLCMSSCADVTAILSYNGKATVVGQETGGGFQGNTSGMMPTAEIPTGLKLTVPLMKYTNAVDLTKNFGRGTIPDYELTQTFDDWIDKKDIEMEFVLKLIKED